MDDFNIQQFYRSTNRVMEYLKILTNNRLGLRRNVKSISTKLHALKLKVAPHKTFIDKISKGFYFMGKPMHPSSILPAGMALSRFQNNTVWYQNQSASKKRVGLFWMRWLGYASLCFPLLSWAADGGPCNGNNFGHNVLGLIATDQSGTPGPLFNNCVLAVPSKIGAAVSMCRVYQYTSVPMTNDFRPKIRKSTSTTVYLLRLFATWPNTAARTGDLSGGCAFVCNGVPCAVKNDGLPVELMQFDLK